MKRLRRLRRWFARKFGFARLICLALLLGLAALRVADPAPVQELRVRVFDTFQRFEPRVKTARPVTIIDIDEKSLAKFGQWPWPRTRIADMVINLSRLGAAAIAIDVLFPEPDRLNPDAVADSMRYLDEATRSRLRALPSNDQILGDAIRRSRVVLGETGLGEVNPQLDKTFPVTGIAMLGEDPQPFLFDFPGLLRNVKPLEEAAAGRGLLTIRTERDGIVRRVPMMLLAQGAMMPSLSFEILRVVTGTPTIIVKSEQAGIKSVGVRGFEVPTDRNGQLWVHFARQDPSIYVSAADVLDGTIPVDKVDHKLVLIGTSAVGLNDIKTTPVSSAMPGVEIHAQVLEAALTKSLLSRPNSIIVVELLAAFVLGILVIIFAPMFGPVALVAIGALFATLVIGTSWYFYSAAAAADRSHLSLAVDDGDLSDADLHQLRARAAQRKQIRGAVRAVHVAGAGRATGAVAGKARARRRGARDDHHVLRRPRLHLDLGILQARSAGPHRADEPLPDAADQRDPRAQGLHRQIHGRRHHGVLERAARRQGRTNSTPAKPRSTCWSASTNSTRCASRRPEAGHPFIPINVGVGLNTGTCVVGNMGPISAFNYSVLGDSVNLASRLEGQSKEYGFPIIVGSKTALAVKEKFAILELDFIMVKGKKEPEVIYAIAGREDTAHSGRFQRLRNLTIEMLACYRGRDWDGALEAIERGRRTDEAHSLELLYNLYEARIRDYQKNPPPARLERRLRAVDEIVSLNAKSRRVGKGALAPCPPSL